MHCASLLIVLAAADSKESELLIAKLQDELAQERLQREQVSQRVKQLEGELDKKLQRREVLKCLC